MGSQAIGLRKPATEVGQGTMRAKSGAELPLQHTAVEAEVAGPLANVVVRQRFQNVSSDPIEAEYVFPLPHQASVFRMQFRIQDRLVVARVRERAQARREYELAVAEGRVATLLEEETPSLFVLSVANVAPHATIEVEMAYQEVLAFDDGHTSFVFPMVAPAQFREVPLLGSPGSIAPPRQATGMRDSELSLEVHFKDPEAAEHLACLSHLVSVTPEVDGGTRVQLKSDGPLLNRDFVLRWRTAGAGVRPRILFERQAGKPGTYLVNLTPSLPRRTTETVSDGSAMKALRCANCGGIVDDLSQLRELPGIGPVLPCSYCHAILTPGTEPITVAKRSRDVLFLIDRSASMGGAMEQAGAAVARVLKALPAGDTASVVLFNHDLTTLSGGALPSGAKFAAVSPEFAREVEANLAAVSAQGGSDLEQALKLCTRSPAQDGHTRVVVLVTDAAVGNEARILRRIPELLGSGTRLLVLGLGAKVNRRLVERLARAGQGASDVIGLRPDPETLDRFARRVSGAGPILTAVSLVWEGGDLSECLPATAPDLYEGEALRLTGRFGGVGPSRLILSALTAQGHPFRQELPIDLPAATSGELGLTRLWARQRVLQLAEEAQAEPSRSIAAKERGLALSLEHSIVGPYTSLVADDTIPTVNPPGPKQEVPIPVAVEMVPLGAVPMSAPVAGGIPMAPPITLSAMPVAFAAPAGLPPSPSFAAPARARAADLPPPSPLPGGFVPAPAAPYRELSEDAERSLAAAPKAASGGVAARLAASVVAGVSGVLRAIGGGHSDTDKEESGAPARPWETRTGAPLGPASAPPMMSSLEPSLPPHASGAGTSNAQPSPLTSAHYSDEELRWLSGRVHGELELVFLVDATGSMGAHISEVKGQILELVAALVKSPLCRSLRIGVVAYRDHPPQESTFVTRLLPLTANIETVRSFLLELTAGGGGDGPEAVTDGLYEVVRLGWRESAVKAVAWFGDAPPHGVEPHNDGFPEGCPCGHHWYTQAETCREMGITICAIGCLPNLSAYAGAEAVYRTVASTTGGLFLALPKARRLIPVVAGAAESALDQERIDAHVEDALARFGQALLDADEDDQIRWLTELLRSQGVQHFDLDRDRVTASDGNAPGHFRSLEPRDIENSLARLKWTERREARS